MLDLISVSYDIQIPNNAGLSSDKRALKALEDVARRHGLAWQEIRTRIREEGRYHVETS